MTSDERKAICAEALDWLGTPYHPNAAVKGVGCDCALGPLAIYRACLPWLPKIEPPRYVHQWHMHQGEELYLNYVLALGAKPVEHPEPGDFALFRQGRLFSHGAIVLGWPKAIHAVSNVGFITEDLTAHARLSRAPRYYFTFQEHK